MDISYPVEAEEFRNEIRQFLLEQLPDDWQGIGALSESEREEFSRRWKQVLHERGLLAVTWPTEFGGSELSLMERVVLSEELTRVGAELEDVQLHIGMNLLGATLLGLGNEEQKAHFLPRILSGEDRWCQGFSEPDSGSDLAGLSTRAFLDGDEWVIDGQKIWTSEAHTANWIFVLCRTDPDAPKNRGLTFMLVPMDQAGVEVREVRNLAGSHDFNEVFLSGARTSKANVVGVVNEGWLVASYLLSVERGGGATTRALLYRQEFERLVDTAHEVGKSRDPLIRQELARAYTRVELMRFIGLRTLTRLHKDGKTGPEGSIFKIMWSEHHTAIAELAMQIIGMDGLAPRGNRPANFFLDLAGAPYSPLSWTWTFLASRSDRIRGGTSEIQRSIIAERVLGLPREMQADAGPWSKSAQRV